MSNDFLTITFGEQLELLDEFIEWVNEKGVATKESRVEQIRFILNRIVQFYNEEAYGEIFNYYSEAEVFYTLTDVTSYFKAYDVLKALRSHEIPRRKLTQIISGPLLPADESAATGNTEGRNILFELEVASKVKDRGHDIIDFDDVQYNCYGTEVNIQCKRVHSQQSTRQNVTNATKQYSRRAKTNPELKGIIAIAIEKTTNTEDYIFECHSQEQINQELDRLVRSYIETHKADWAYLCDQGVVGVLVFVKFLAKLNGRATPMLIVARTNILYHTCEGQKPILL